MSPQRGDGVDSSPLGLLHYALAGLGLLTAGLSLLFFQFYKSTNFSNLDAVLDAGRYELAHQRYAQALDSRRESLSESDLLHLENGRAVAWAADVLSDAEQGEAADLIDVVQRNFTRPPSDDARFRRHVLARIAELEGRTSDRERIFADLAKKDPSNVGDVVSWAQSMMSHHPDDLREVLPYLEGLLRGGRHRKNFELYELAAEIYGLWLGDFERSYELYARLVDITDEEPQRRDSAPFMLTLLDFGSVLAAMGKRLDALALFGHYSHLQMPFSEELAQYGHAHEPPALAHERPAKRFGAGADAVRAFDKAQPEALQSAMMRAFGGGSSFWKETRYFERGGAATTFFEAVPFPAEGADGRMLVHQVVEQMFQYMETEVVKQVVGVEWWVHKRPRHRAMKVVSGQPLHFDVDEETDKKVHGAMYSPIWSSVTFVDGDVGGETIVMEWDAEDHMDKDRGRSAGAYLVPPRSNRFLLFRGTLYHGVLPGFPEDLEAKGGVRGQRVTLLVNFWGHALPTHPWEGYYERAERGERFGVVATPRTLHHIIPELQPVRLDEAPQEHVRNAQDVTVPYVARATMPMEAA